MPELPEVETVRRGLEPVLVGSRVQRLDQRRPDLRFPLPERFAARVEGRTILSLSRRAKYLQARLDSGETLVMHLGMTGRFTVSPPPAVNTPSPLGERRSEFAAFAHPAGGVAAHDHVILHLSTGASVTYNDARRFGFMLLIPDTELERHPLFVNLGVEPLGNELHSDYLAFMASGRRSDLKAFLMDQRIVAGLGNIYVCEALHRAQLDPGRSAACLALKSGRPSPRATRLVPAIRTVLEAAIAAGGSTLRDYRHADGALGYFQHQFLVYGREGEPCARPGCKGIVRRTIQAGRSTFHCPSCQR
jgi:formamidopyrimidine-DNA glycosylase